MDDRQLIEDLLSALEYHTEQTRPIEFSKVAIEAAREHLRKPAQQEPVALETVYETIIQWDEGGGKRSRRELARRIVALYTSPPAQPAQRKPLTDEKVEKIIKDNMVLQMNLAGIRQDFEAAHGIKE